MIIKQITIKDFRCFESKKVCFSPGLNIIYGSNAIGKTTVLEAISCLSFVKSFRCSEQKELIKHGNEGFYLEGVLFDGKKDVVISLVEYEKWKLLKKNGVKVEKISDYLGYFNVVLFSAVDFLVLKGSPKERRNMFDLIFCQISKDYLRAFNYYKSLLKDRNALLKSLKIESKSNLLVLLDVISLRLAEAGEIVRGKRIELLKKINVYSKQHHLNISCGTEDLDIEYLKVDQKSLKDALYENLKEDIYRGSTSVGPHRDDYIFIINNKNVAKFCSQGQQRNALLSTKLAFVSLLENIKQDSPVVLLDDVFSELDKNRQNALIKCLNNNWNIVITAASITDLDNEITKKANLIELKAVENLLKNVENHNNK